jgi:hypothetical protein
LFAKQFRKNTIKLKPIAEINQALLAMIFPLVDILVGKVAAKD